MKIPLIRHDSRIRMVWDVLMVFAVFYTALLIPYRMISGVDPFDFTYWIITIIFCSDIIINFNTQLRVKVTLLTDRKSIAKQYLKSWFIPDFMAAFPFAPLMLLILGIQASGSILIQILMMLRLLRLLKLFKVTETFKELQEIVSLPPALMRLSIFLFWFALIAHYMALGWIVIGASEVHRSFFDQYLRSLYWCITTIATIGYEDYAPNKESNIQIIYTMIVQVLGVGMYSYIIGNVATLIVNIDTARADFLARMEQIRNFMRLKKIPTQTQNRVKNYYNYIWETRRSISKNDLLSEMPHTLRMEISLFLNREILQKVPLFNNESEVFVHEVIELLEPLVFLPGDMIIRQGEFGDCMYFLSSGEAEIQVNNTFITTLFSGSPFGETALIQGEKRNASVLALTYCDVFRLSKHNFDILREKYPEFNRKVKDIAEQRSKEIAERNKS